MKEASAPWAAFIATERITDAVVLAGQLHAAGTLTVADAQMLMDQARGWHAAQYLDEQRQVCRLALALMPLHAEALHLLGVQAQTAGRFDEAKDYFARAMEADPNYAFARLALGQIELMQSGFTRGAPHFEARFSAMTEGSGPDWRGLPVQRWRGESLRSRQLYLWAEQGLGDMVMFAGFVHRLCEQSPSLLRMALYPKLMTLFARSFPGIRVEPLDEAGLVALAPSALAAFPVLMQHAGDALPEALLPLKNAYKRATELGVPDFHAPFGDLMLHLPPLSQPAYLHADEKRVNAVRERLARLGDRPLIGFSWQTSNRREWARNIALEECLPLLSLNGKRFVSLQHGVEPQEIARFNALYGVRLVSDEASDIAGDAEDLSALIAAMDAVVSVDNSNIHLAGALGVPSLLLLAAGHNYRWPQCEAKGTLWYKSVVTARQHAPFDWRVPLEEAVDWVAGI